MHSVVESHIQAMVLDGCETASDGVHVELPSLSPSNHPSR